MRTHNIELEIWRDKQKKTLQKLPVFHIEEMVLQYESKIPLEYAILFWFQFASIYFMQKNYAASLKWINKVLNLGSREVRLDLQVYARILNLMIHLELKNLFVLGHYIDSTKRYLKKNNVYDEWKIQLLRFFSKMRRTPEYESRLLFETLSKQLFPDGQQALLSNEVLDYIDIGRWLEQYMRQEQVEEK